MRDFLAGISTIPPAMRLLTTPGLRRFVGLPILINAVVFVGLFVLGYAWLQSLIAGWLPDPSAFDTGSWFGWLAAVTIQLLLWLLLPIYLMATAVIAFFSFTVVANLIAAPFNGMLSARVEARISGDLPAGINAGSLVIEVAGAIRDELRKLAYFSVWLVPLLLLTLIPGINLLAGPLWLLAGIWMMTLEYMDYPLGNRGMAFPDQRRWLRGQRLYHAGMGAGILAMTLIPGLNLIAMPTGVIAATLLHRGRHPSNRPAANPPASPGLGASPACISCALPST